MCCQCWQPYYGAFMSGSHRSGMSTASLDSSLFCVMLLLLLQTQFINGHKHQEGTAAPLARRQAAEEVRVARSCLLALLQRVCCKRSKQRRLFGGTVDGSVIWEALSDRSGGVYRSCSAYPARPPPQPD